MEIDRENELLRVKIVAMVGELKRISKTITLLPKSEFEAGQQFGKASMLQTVVLMLEVALKDE